jgi:hypothetical protein
VTVDDVVKYKDKVCVIEVIMPIERLVLLKTQLENGDWKLLNGWYSLDEVVGV